MGKSPSQNAEHQQLSVRPPNPNFHSVLVNVIDSTKDDPAYVRRLVYELARIKLTKEAWRNPSISHAELKAHLRKLDTAIDDVETVSAREEQIRTLLSAYQARLNGHARPVETIEVLAPVPGGTTSSPAAPMQPRKPSIRAPVLLLLSGVAAGFLLLGGVVVSGVIAARYDLNSFRSFGSIRDAPQPRAIVRPEVAEAPVGRAAEHPVEPTVAAKPAVRAPAFPLPTSFGVYALSGGQLSQLDVLPGRAPDQRVAVGPVIQTPAQTILSDGQIAFIVFRRDLVANAPDRASVRVVARIARAMTFEGGKPTSTKLETAWAMRSKSYEFKVAPLGENQEMIIIRPESEDFALPPGRYALVLKGQSYDFSIAGAITDRSQCLERVDALNGTVYSECRTL